jgi:hypothetical protein
VDGGASTASAVTYDNTQSGIVATSAQQAIDEVDARLDALENNEITAEKVDNVETAVGDKVILKDKDGKQIQPIVDASAVIYNNGDVQQALDEIYSNGTEYAYNWKSATDAANDGSTEGSLKDLYNQVQTKADTTEQDICDLAVEDPSMNILVEFKNGGIKTKNFDSTNVPTKNDIENFTAVEDTENTEGPDFNIIDEKGFKILSINEGYPVTKNFNGKDMDNIESGKLTKIYTTLISQESFQLTEPSYSYIACDYNFTEEVILDSIDIARHVDDSVGTEVHIVLGTRDQRSWLLNIRNYTCRITSVREVNGITISTITPQETIFVSSDDYIFIEIDKAKDVQTFNYGSSDDTSHTLWYGTDDASDISTYYQTVGLSYCVCYGYTLRKTTLWSFLRETMSNVSDNTSRIESNEIALKQLNPLTDVVTGGLYTLQVKNGVLGLKSMSVKNILILGHSHTNHAVAYYQDLESLSKYPIWYSDNRAMAATTDDTQWHALLKEGIGTDAYIERANSKIYNSETDEYETKVGCAAIEQNYKKIDDISEALVFDKTKNYDLIIVYISENMSVSSSSTEDKNACTQLWTNMFSYFKESYPDAYILQVCFSSETPQSWLIRSVCSTFNAAFLKTDNLLAENKPTAGDYVKVSDKYVSEFGDYQYMRSVITGHPSDMYMALFANTLLSKYGYKELNYIHKVNLVQKDNGTISCSSDNWVYRGICSIKCTPLDGHTISSISIVDSLGLAVSAEYKENQFGKYYIFTMPNRDVTVTPTFD